MSSFFLKKAHWAILSEHGQHMGCIKQIDSPGLQDLVLISPGKDALTSFFILESKVFLLRNYVHNDDCCAALENKRGATVVLQVTLAITLHTFCTLSYFTSFAITYYFAFGAKSVDKL